MSKLWAEKFDDISIVLKERNDLRTKIMELIDRENIAGKVTEESYRLMKFKSILKDYVNGKYNLEQAILQVEIQLPKATSKYSNNVRVFPDNWAERLVRIQYSRFYNQYVLEHLIKTGSAYCFVPNTNTQKPDSNCTVYLAGRKHEVRMLHQRLLENYSKGNWSTEPKIPDHLYCSHVVKPIS